MSEISRNFLYVLKLMTAFGVSIKLPDCLHQSYEMIVIVNRGAHSCIVVIPFVSLNFTISVPVVEAWKEFQKHLVFRHLPRDHLGMERTVVDPFQVSSVYVAIPVSIEFQKCLIHHGLSAGIKPSLYLMTLVFLESFFETVAASHENCLEMADDLPWLRLRTRQSSHSRLCQDRSTRGGSLMVWDQGKLRLSLASLTWLLFPASLWKTPRHLASCYRHRNQELWIPFQVTW